MPSTYSPSLGIELIGNGEQAGTWGQTTNNNLGTLIEQAIAGVQPITLTGDYTLTDFNGLPDESRNAVLVFNGSLGAPANVTAPAVEKVYIVRNVSGATVTVKTSSGNGVALTNAASAVIFCDGTDFYSATTLNFIDGNLTVTGTATIGGAFTANSSVTLKGDVFANSNTGQMYIPVGTTGQRTGSPINGVFRYNSTLNVYEGYANGEWVNFQTYAQASYTINYLVVAGGGGGSTSAGGGGGGGGVVASSTVLTPGTTYTFVIGAGGSSSGTSGTNSVFTGVVTTLGGGGPGASGGSGGGGGGLGTAGQGFNGGTNVSGAGGGGGGGTTNGFSATGSSSGGVGYSFGGNGGAGLTSSITGSAIPYAGGGGGGKSIFLGPGSPGANGAGGGSTVNRGGGGQGAVVNPGPSPSEPGGSGVIILSIPTINYSGTTTGAPTVSISGSNTILTYTTSGSYTA